MKFRGGMRSANTMSQVEQGPDCRCAIFSYSIGAKLQERSMTNAKEKRAIRTAESKGYRLEKVGKGPHHGRFSIVNVAEGARMPSAIPGAEYSFSLDEAEAWFAKH